LNTKEKKIDVSYPEKLFQMRRNLIHEAKQQQHRHPIVLHAISKDRLNRLKNKINFFFFTVETTAESIVFAYVYTCVYAVSSSSA
jgi:hypothetical protein